MFTPAQTAEMLQIATSTLRKYSAAFSAYLSPSANRKQRTYTATDIATLKRICDLRSQGVPLAEIGGQPQVIDDTPAPDNSLAMVPAIAAQFDNLYNQIARMADDQAAEIKALRTRLDRLENPPTLWQRITHKKPKV